MSGYSTFASVHRAGSHPHSMHKISKDDGPGLLLSLRPRRHLNDCCFDLTRACMRTDCLIRYEQTCKGIEFCFGRGPETPFHAGKLEIILPKCSELNYS